MPQEIKIEGLEYLYHEGDLYAIILRDKYTGASNRFFTPDSYSQQLGHVSHTKGEIIQPHEHQITKKEIDSTQEVVFIKKGKVQVNIFNKKYQQVLSELVESGDVIILCRGGHGFEILEDAIMIVVKQGPYSEDDNKKPFDGISTFHDVLT